MTEEEILDNEIVARTKHSLNASDEQTEDDEHLFSLADFGSRGILPSHYRDTASAEAFFRQAIERAELVPEEVTDYHQPYVKAVATTPRRGTSGRGCTEHVARRLKLWSAATCPCATECATAVD